MICTQETVDKAATRLKGSVCNRFRISDALLDKSLCYFTLLALLEWSSIDAEAPEVWLATALPGLITRENAKTDPDLRSKMVQYNVRRALRAAKP